jgi:hypothetical protein
MTDQQLCVCVSPIILDHARDMQDLTPYDLSPKPNAASFMDWHWLRISLEQCQVYVWHEVKIRWQEAWLQGMRFHAPWLTAASRATEGGFSESSAPSVTWRNLKLAKEIMFISWGNGWETSDSASLIVARAFRMRFLTDDLRVFCLPVVRWRLGGR